MAKRTAATKSSGSKEGAKRAALADPAAEIADLTKAIRRHDKLYYQQDAPEISDAKYDALRRRLIALEAENPALAKADSPTQRVGAAPAGGFGKIRHDAPMLSLGNAFSDEDVLEFVARVRRFLNVAAEDPLDITAEPKIDGLSISLRYEGGKLATAATRGDGSKVKTSRRT